LPTKRTQTFTILPQCQSDKIVMELSKFYVPNPTEQLEALKPFQNTKFNVDIKVFEGENELAEKNNLLGYFTLSDILLSSNKRPQIEITFDIDANGILSVSAMDKNSKNENKIIVTNDKGRLSKLEKENIIKNLDKYDQEDEY